MVVGIADAQLFVVCFQPEKVILALLVLNFDLFVGLLDFLILILVFFVLLCFLKQLLKLFDFLFLFFDFFFKLLDLILVLLNIFQLQFSVAVCVSFLLKFLLKQF